MISSNNMFKKSNSSLPYFQSISYQLNPIAPSTPTAKKRFITEIYYNPRLEGKIKSIEPNSRVDLSYWNLINQDLLTITKRIIINKQCTELCLCGNKITSEGALLLALKLFNNSTLNILDLSYNFIADGGVHSISQILSPNHYSAVTILSLNKNGISNDGVQYLADVLQTNQTLRELSLSNNEIGDGGVKQLANVLIYRNRTLKVLLLSYNVFIMDLSIDHLLRMFEYNQTLERLSINNCNFSQAGKTRLRENVKRKPNFDLIT